MKLNRRYYRFVELKVTEKKLRFSGGLTEYFPPNPQLVNLINEFVLLSNAIIYYQKFWNNNIKHKSHDNVS